MKKIVRRTGGGVCQRYFISEFARDDDGGSLVVLHDEAVKMKQEQIFNL